MPRRVHQRIASLTVAQLDLGLMLQEDAAAGGIMRDRGRRHQRAEAVGRPYIVHLRPALAQPAHRCRVALRTRDHQRVPAVAHRVIGLGALLEQRRDQLVEAIVRRRDHGIVAILLA